MKERVEQDTLKAFDDARNTADANNPQYQASIHFFYPTGVCPTCNTCPTCGRKSFNQAYPEYPSPYWYW